MELGGKDPMIVCEDADLQQAVHSALGGCFINLGQNCIASERIIVLDAIYDRFLAEVERYTRNLRQGAPTTPGQMDVGAICSPLQVKVIDTLVSDALANGAKALVGGVLPKGPGNFYPLTVLADVPGDARIMREEPFGPVALLVRVRDVDEAIERANSVSYGLAGYAFTNSARDMQRLSPRLEVGNLAINHLMASDADLPFGGVKDSGLGREGGAEGPLNHTVVKTVSTLFPDAK